METHKGVNSKRDDVFVPTKVMVYQNMVSPASPVTRHIRINPDVAIPLSDNNSEYIGSVPGQRNTKKQRLKQDRS